MPREEAADNTIAILSRVKGYAEQKEVTLCMEITNSKVIGINFGWWLVIRGWWFVAHDPQSAVYESRRIHASCDRCRQ